MKYRTLLTLFILFVCAYPNLCAQNLSWTDPSNEWRYDYFIMASSQSNSTYISLNVLEEEINIGSRKCFALRPSSPAGEIIHNDGEDIIIWVDEDGVVYRYVDSAFHLLYNFDLEAGDIYQIYVPYAAAVGVSDPFLRLRVDSVTIREINSLPIRAQYVTAISGVNASFSGWNYEYFGNLDNYFVPINPINCDGACPEGQRCFSSTDQGFEVNFSGLSCDFISSTNDLADVSDALRVYPNPIGGSKEVLVELPLDLVTQASSLVLINQLGQPVYQQEMAHGAVVNRLLLRDLPGGVYYLVWESTTARARKKLVLVE